MTNRSPQLQAFIDSLADELGITEEFDEASDHKYTCTCDIYAEVISWKRDVLYMGHREAFSVSKLSAGNTELFYLDNILQGKTLESTYMQRLPDVYETIEEAKAIANHAAKQVVLDLFTALLNDQYPENE